MRTIQQAYDAYNKDLLVKQLKEDIVLTLMQKRSNTPLYRSVYSEGVFTEKKHTDYIATINRLADMLYAHGSTMYPELFSNDIK